MSLPSGSTSSACAAQCSLNSNCYAWAFDNCGGINCWLKSAGGSTSSNSCRTSGIKGIFNIINERIKIDNIITCLIGHIGFDIAGNDLSMLTLVNQQTNKQTKDIHSLINNNRIQQQQQQHVQMHVQAHQGARHGQW